MRFVEIDNLRIGMTVGQDVFISSADAALLAKGQQLTARFIERMKEHGLPGVYIYDPNKPSPLVLNNEPAISPQLKQEGLTAIEHMFSAIENSASAEAVKVIKHLDSVVDNLIDSLSYNKGVLINIDDIKSYDDYTYHHSMSVSILSIAIGIALGIPRAKLNKLGQCAVLHDIGKIFVPLEIINKPDKLTPIEFQEIKKHPLHGYSYIKEHGIGSPDVGEIVCNHHEKIDGTGYPRGLKGRDIHVYSRIISVADVYDALTSQRPYRTPSPPSEALEFIMGGCGTAFDYDVVQAFVAKVELYPVGSLVLLSNNETARILSNQKNRPTVEILDSGRIIDLYRNPQYLNVVILRSLPASETPAA
ncbi:MAG: HD-GYP domain-containing protein [Gracilibacteraceae bacterium]|jgi:HD-GYP domain-containing protein (c-di-GMP phosphodiesterase class II)|nr:HD-GYP domain-containing protein [Gracilibacteraceae bacterium]